jgi:hypothetical protein
MTRLSSHGGSGGGGGSIGSPISGGTPNSVLYIDASGNLAEDNPDFSYIPDTSFSTFGIQNDLGNYNLGDFFGRGNGVHLNIDDASEKFFFNNTISDGAITLEATSPGAGVNKKFTFLNPVFGTTFTSSDLMTANQLIVAGELTDAYQFRVSADGSFVMRLEANSGSYMFGDIDGIGGNNYLLIDDASDQFLFNNTRNNGRIDLQAATSGAGPAYFNFLAPVTINNPLTVTGLGTFRQILIDGNTADAYQFRVKSDGSFIMRLEATAGTYMFGDIDGIGGTNYFLIDDASSQFIFNNGLNNGRIDLQAATSGAGPAFFNFIPDVSIGNSVDVITPCALWIERGGGVFTIYDFNSTPTPGNNIAHGYAVLGGIYAYSGFRPVVISPGGMPTNNTFGGFFWSQSPSDYNDEAVKIDTFNYRLHVKNLDGRGRSTLNVGGNASFGSGIQNDGFPAPTDGILVQGESIFQSDITIPDEAYSSAWDGVLEAPTKNAIYDLISAPGGVMSNSIAYAVAL